MVYYRCVLPNKMFIQLAENVNPSEACATRPQGVVRICAIEAKNLMKKDVSHAMHTVFQKTRKA